MNHTQPRMNAGRPSWMAASLILWLVGAGPVAAQITPSPSFPNNRANLPVVLPGYYHQPWAGNPWSAWGWQGYSEPGTAYSANAQAWSSVIRAQGEYEVQSAQAAKLRVDLEDQERQRRIAQRQAYFQMQQAKSEAARERNIARRNRRESMLARSESDQLASTLGPNELDPSTGKVNWPTLLRTEAFRASTAEIDKQMRSWADSSSSKKFDAAVVDREIDNLREQLREKIQEVSMRDYFDARLFIDRIESTLRMPAKS
jgi:hypothetical protein